MGTPRARALPILMLAFLIGLAGCADKVSDAEMHASVRQDIAQVMEDIDTASRRDPGIGMSSNPYDYVGISPAFERLVARGAPALDAIAAEIQESDENGLREYLLAIAGQRIQGDTGPSMWSTGKQWAEKYRKGD
jgi:hypothetical protein